MRIKLFMVILAVAMLLPASAAFAEDTPRNLDTAPDALTCNPWYDWSYLTDWDWDGDFELRNPPFNYGGFDSPAGWLTNYDRRLGEKVTMFFPVFEPAGTPASNYPVDVYLWRPPTITYCVDDVDPTLDGWYKYWPLFDNARKADNGWGGAWNMPSWYAAVWDNPDGARRQSWPTYQTTDAFGFYYAKFMLPRDEVWYPCDWPCQWQCNFYDPWTGNSEFHSPWLVSAVYPAADPFTPEWYYPLYYPLYWPWKYYNDGVIDFWRGDLAATAENESSPYTDLPSWVEPEDTTAPLTLWVVDGRFNTYINLIGSPAPWLDIEVTGYYWKPSDLEVEWPMEWPMECPSHAWVP